MPVNRFYFNSKIFVYAFLLVCILCGSASAAQMDLMEGNARRGPVSVMERNGMLFVSLVEVMTRLSYSSSPIQDGFVVTFSGRTIEFWNGSNIARINGAMSPLAAAVIFDGVHWWGEAASSFQAIRQFLSSASRPSDVSLAPTTTALPPAQTPTPTPILTPTPAPPPTSTPATIIPPQSVSPGDALISRVRWGEQIDAYRAVVDISRQVETAITESPGRVEVTFRSTGTLFTSGGSPWPQISVETRRTNDGVTLIFSHSSQTIRGFWVADPPRYVVDFYFNGAGPEPGSQVRTSNENVIVNVPASVPNTGRIQTTPHQGARTRALVVIDAGHGGHDPGAVGNNLREKDINLLAALQLGISLKELGADTRLTRQDDRFLRLAERSEIANDSDADIFISIHCNALPAGRRASGFEIYIMAEHSDQDALNLAIAENREISGDAENADAINDAADRRTRLLLQILGDMQQSDKLNESTNLAEFVYNRLRGAGVAMRNVPVRQAPFYVLRGAGMPALLLEMGYITDAGDARKLNSQAERKKMMDAVASGIMEYLAKRPGEGGRL